MKKHRIEIHSNQIDKGIYTIWFKYNNKKHFIIISEQETNSLLNMRQKEDFFMGKYIFNITETDFKLIILKKFETK